MPYAPLPYIPQQYDSTATDNRMADLRRYRSQVVANNAARVGDQQARTILGIGNMVQNSIGDLVKWREEAPNRALNQRRMSDEIRQRDEADRFRAVQQQVAGKSPEERAAALAQAGFPDQAEAVTDKARQNKVSEAALYGAELKNQTEALRHAGSILETVAQQKTPEGRKAAYAASYPQIQKLVPHLKDSIPTPDLFDDDFLEVGRDYGKTEPEKLAERRDRVLAQDAIDRAAKSAQERADKTADSLGTYLSQARDANEWDEMRMDALRAGAPKQVVDLFGDDFSEEAKKRALAIARGTKGTTAGTAHDRDLELYARQLGKNVENLTRDDVRKFNRENTADTDKTPGGGGGAGTGPGSPSRAAAIRARDSVIREAKAGSLGRGVSNAQKLADVINGAWESYYESINEKIPDNIQAEIAIRDLEAEYTVKNPKKKAADDPELTKKKNEILAKYGQRYDTNTNGSTAPPAVPGATPAKAAPQTFKDAKGRTWTTGQTIYFNGKPRTIKGYSNGQLELEPER